MISETKQTRPNKSVDVRNADVTLRLLEEHGHEFGPLTKETERKLRRIIYWRLMTLLSAINIVLFVSCVDCIIIIKNRLTVSRSISRRSVTQPFWDCSKKPRSPRLNTII